MKRGVCKKLAVAGAERHQKCGQSLISAATTVLSFARVFCAPSRWVAHVTWNLIKLCDRERGGKARLAASVCRSRLGLIAFVWCTPRPRSQRECAFLPWGARIRFQTSLVVALDQPDGKAHSSLSLSLSLEKETCAYLNASLQLQIRRLLLLLHTSNWNQFQQLISISWSRACAR